MMLFMYLCKTWVDYLPNPMVIICGYAKVNQLRAGWAMKEADGNLSKIKRVL